MQQNLVEENVDVLVNLRPKVNDISLISPNVQVRSRIQILIYNFLLKFMMLELISIRFIVKVGETTTLASHNANFAENSFTQSIFINIILILIPKAKQ